MKAARKWKIIKRDEKSVLSSNAKKFVNRKDCKNNKFNEEVEVQRTNAKNVVLSLQSCSFILFFTLIEGQFDGNECSL